MKKFRYREDQEPDSRQKKIREGISNTKLKYFVTDQLFRRSETENISSMKISCLIFAVIIVEVIFNCPANSRRIETSISVLARSDRSSEELNILPNSVNHSVNNRNRRSLGSCSGIFSNEQNSIGESYGIITIFDPDRQETEVKVVFTVATRNYQVKIITTFDKLTSSNTNTSLLRAPTVAYHSSRARKMLSKMWTTENLYS